MLVAFAANPIFFVALGMAGRSIFGIVIPLVLVFARKHAVLMREVGGGEDADTSQGRRCGDENDFLRILHEFLLSLYFSPEGEGT